MNNSPILVTFTLSPILINATVAPSTAIKPDTALLTLITSTYNRLAISAIKQSSPITGSFTSNTFYHNSLFRYLIKIEQKIFSF